MLFFIDESWQSAKDGRNKVGVLSAIPINSDNFNQVSLDIYNLKKKHLGFQASNLELKGQKILQRYYFRLEQKGIKSIQLNLARDIFSLCETHGIKTFASVVSAKSELGLDCANENQLERPFFFLFERINQFMNEKFPSLVAKLVFDDRGVTTNKRISRSVSNFFHKSRTGRAFDRILKVPLFAISTENIGIQIADLVGYVIGKSTTKDRNIIMEFYQKVKNMQYEGQEVVGEKPVGQPIILRGIKFIKEKINASDNRDEIESDQ